jgi:hypothetical protein
MTDDEFFRHVTDKVNQKRRESGESEVTEAQVREGLDIIAAVTGSVHKPTGESI